jgi:hypothetical protein
MMEWAKVKTSDNRHQPKGLAQLSLQFGTFF